MSDECITVVIDLVHFEDPGHDSQKLRIVVVLPGVQFTAMADLVQRELPNLVGPELHTPCKQLVAIDQSTCANSRNEAGINHDEPRIGCDEACKTGHVGIGANEFLPKQFLNLLLASPRAALPLWARSSMR
jgi:hypothetical protein